MKKLLPFLFFVLFSAIFYAQDEQKESPDTAKIGIYIISLYDLDFPSNELNADFYVWYNYTNDSLKLIETFEVINAKEFSKLGETSEKYGNIRYESIRCKARIKKEWDVRSFPFDKQVIEIIIEDLDKDNTNLIFVPDTAGSRIDKAVKLEGWVIEDYNVKTANHTYETTYGDPSLGKDEFSSYSRVIISFKIQREGGGLFFKLFVGLFISVLISMMTFFINPTDLDPRFGLPVGAIFASIASQYVITSTLPVSQQLTLVDILHDVSFIYIFLCILLSTISLYLIKNEKQRQSSRLDKISFFSLTFSYFLIVIVIILSRV